MRGAPVETWSQAQAELFFWCFGLHVGRPGEQNPDGDLLGHVTDTGDRERVAMVRLYKTAAHIEYHCDAADVVGLLDTYEAIALEPGMYLDMDLQPGDIQLLSNHTMLHARTAYADFEHPEQRRHLLRLWLSL